MIIANYSVRFEVEVRAATPAQAATMARDLMLDPTAKINADVYPMEYVEAAEDWFPVYERGWQARFDGDVRPEECIEWETLFE